MDASSNIAGLTYLVRIIDGEGLHCLGKVGKTAGRGGQQQRREGEITQQQHLVIADVRARKPFFIHIGTGIQDYLRTISLAQNAVYVDRKNAFCCMLIASVKNSLDKSGGGWGGGEGRVAIPEQFADKSLTNDPIIPDSLMWGSGPPFSRVFLLSSTVNHTQTIATFGTAPLAALCDSPCACFSMSQLLGR